MSGNEWTDELVSTCPVCGEFIDYCQGGHETDEDGFLMVDEWQAERMFEEFMDDCYGEVTLGGLTYSHSHAWKATDPIAYRLAMFDWADSESITIV